MTTSAKLRYLPAALVLTGVISMGAGVLFVVWPSGWRWQPYQPFYEQMILGIYATLGVFLLIAARDPTRHLSLIWFTVWSSIVHGGIMAAQAVVYSEHQGHLVGDVPALFLVALLLGLLTPRAYEVAAPPDG